MAFEEYADGEVKAAEDFFNGKLSKWVVAMVEASVKLVSCNTYISALNVFYGEIQLTHSETAGSVLQQQLKTARKILFWP